MRVAENRHPGRPRVEDHFLFQDAAIPALPGTVPGRNTDLDIAVHQAGRNRAQGQLFFKHGDSRGEFFGKKLDCPAGLVGFDADFGQAAFPVGYSKREFPAQERRIAGEPDRGFFEFEFDDDKPDTCDRRGRDEDPAGFFKHVLHRTALLLRTILIPPSNVTLFHTLFRLSR
jgi:hypothetical protein